MSGGWREMLTETGMPRVPEVRSSGRAGGGLVLGLLSPCHIESMYELCRGVETLTDNQG